MQPVVGEDAVEHGVSLAPVEAEVAQVVEIHAGEPGENLGLASIEYIGVQWARRGEYAVEHIEAVAGSIALHVGAESQESTQLQQEAKVKIGLPLVDKVEYLNGLRNKGKELRVGLGLLDGLANHFGQKEDLGVFHRVGMDILQGEHGTGLDNLLQFARVAIVDVEFENREGHEQRAVHASLPTVSLREQKRGAPILAGVEVCHGHLVVIGNEV